MWLIDYIQCTHVKLQVHVFLPEYPALRVGFSLKGRDVALARHHLKRYGRKPQTSGVDNRDEFTSKQSD